MNGYGETRLRRRVHPNPLNGDVQAVSMYILNQHCRNSNVSVDGLTIPHLRDNLLSHAVTPALLLGHHVVIPVY